MPQVRQTAGEILKIGDFFLYYREELGKVISSYTTREYNEDWFKVKIKIDRLIKDDIKYGNTACQLLTLSLLNKHLYHFPKFTSGYQKKFVKEALIWLATRKEH